MSDRPMPTELTLHRRSRVLEIVFTDGARYLLPCEYLRVYSPSAEVRGHVASEWRLVEDKEGVNITDLQQVGSYAVKIIFDDGHQTGLYDWGYLYQIGKNRHELWTLYLERLQKAGKGRKAPDPFASSEPQNKE
jgi:DUF971 family protein